MIKQTILAFILTVGFGSIILTPVASAATLKCGGVDTSIISCTQAGGKEVEQTGVWGILLLVINILTAGIGVAAVGGVIYGAVLYTTAGGSMDQTKKSKAIIFNTVIGIGAYALMYAFLNFLIPGGLFT